MRSRSTWSRKARKVMKKSETRSIVDELGRGDLGDQAGGVAAVTESVVEDMRTMARSSHCGLNVRASNMEGWMARWVER